MSGPSVQLSQARLVCNQVRSAATAFPELRILASAAWRAAGNVAVTVAPTSRAIPRKNVARPTLKRPANCVPTKERRRASSRPVGPRTPLPPPQPCFGACDQDVRPFRVIIFRVDFDQSQSQGFRK